MVRLAALLVGVVTSFAFPFAIDGEPLLDFLPRELLILVGAAWLYRGKHAFIAGVGFFGFLFYWIATTMHRYAGVPLVVAVVAIGLFVLYSAAYWALIPRLARWASVYVHPFIAFAAAVLTVDWLRTWFIAPCPGGQWSWAVTRDTPLIQLAALFGSHGVTALVALAGAALADARARPRAALVVAGLVALVHLGGFLRGAATDDETVRVAAIQANVPQSIKSATAQNTKMIEDRYTQASQRAVAEGAKIVLWPETAWPYRIAPDTKTFPFKVDATLLAGVVTLRYDSEGYGWATNSVLAVNAQGEVEGRYDKIALVPFGEYVPVVASLGIDKLVKTFGFMTPGTSTQPLAGAGVSICYDGIFPWIPRHEVHAGARFLTDQTNDAWYDKTSGPYLHRDMYVLRAVENDRWLVRATNTGVSALIDPHGVIRQATRLGEETVLAGDIGLRDTRTVYNRIGDVVTWLALAITGCGVVRRVYERLQARRRIGSERDGVV